ncbi:hypothetical protein BE20_07160 [Sorangium cellulosum]|uniref:Nudix hydrolase domain-containing protein n=1 Tax=Sorangium cellulosum TaxID=56 RepID=A0A150R9X0_SORCE|nr:hypothetical protein BE18_36455 [Sorangium cellulosum]KYF94195.1 hypothetical protein BE20_07160 [Sorangium cellulosum]
MQTSFGSSTRPIPADQRSLRRWCVAVNGEQQTDVLYLVLDHPSFGTLTYGLTAGGHDGWTFHERGGGGSVILPFCRSQGELIVGLVEQERPLQGKRVLNAPRGFLECAEGHAVAAARELMEEMGFDAAALALTRLPGAPANPNSTFFETLGPGEGVHFFALEIPETLLTEDRGHRTFVASVIATDQGARRSRLAEQIGAAVFIPWYEAAMLGDMFTNAAVARLLAAQRDADPVR